MENNSEASALAEKGTYLLQTLGPNPGLEELNVTSLSEACDRTSSCGRRQWHQLPCFGTCVSQHLGQFPGGPAVVPLWRKITNAIPMYDCCPLSSSMAQGVDPLYVFTCTRLLSNPGKKYTLFGLNGTTLGAQKQKKKK